MANHAGGRLRLPKIGSLRVKWSRTLPSQPSTVTVVKDSAGRYFASFVVETDPATDLARFESATAVLGLDLGLNHFAVLCARMRRSPMRGASSITSSPPR